MSELIPSSRGRSAAPAQPSPHVLARALNASASRPDLGFVREDKQGGRFVGSWALEVAPPEAGARAAGYVRATLHACAASVLEHEVNVAFLKVCQWVAQPGEDPARLYAGVAREVLQRLQWLMSHALPARVAQGYGLRLLDRCPAGTARWQLSRLEAQLQLLLGRGDAVPGLALHIVRPSFFGRAAVSAAPP